MSASESLVDLEMVRARRSLEAAEMLLARQFFEDAVSRAYYAVLHASRAALLAADISPATHEGVRRMFGLHLVKAGHIEQKFATILTAQQEDRELSDYDVTFEMEEERARQRHDEATKFVARIQAYLKQEPGR